MSSGEATQTAKSDTKLTLEQRDHVLKHHLGLAIVDDRIRVSYVHECGNNPCPVQQEPFILLCKRPPCY